MCSLYTTLASSLASPLFAKGMACETTWPLAQSQVSPDALSLGINASIYAEKMYKNLTFGKDSWKQSKTGCWKGLESSETQG